VGASDELSERYDAERLLVAGPPDGELRRAARAGGASIVQIRRGATFRWGAVKVKVLSPDSITGDANANSVVLLLEVAGRGSCSPAT
jgi:beta-lactamase superfamily II metal-dependent hydrolase